MEGSGREGVSWVCEQPPGGASAILGVEGVCLVACVPSGVVRALCRLGGSCSWEQQAALGAGVPASAPLDASHSALTWVPPRLCWPGSRLRSQAGGAGPWLQTAGAQAQAEGAAAQPARRAFSPSPFLSAYFLPFLVCAVRGPLSISRPASSCICLPVNHILA